MVKIFCDCCGKEIEAKKEHGLFSEVKLRMSQYEKEENFHLHIACAVRLKNKIGTFVKEAREDA